jgi:uncharacterized protein (DUF924 family)
MDPLTIVAFWFADDMRRAWFRSTPALDATIRKRFEDLWRRAAGGKLDDWADTPVGALALVIVLDQFPLNMFRGGPEAYATADAAVTVSRRAVAEGLDRALTPEQRTFLYMPLMHSEDIADQDLAVDLFTAAGLADNLRFARHHREIVRRFGRFPHRNRILGRQSTAEEEAYLASKEAFLG